MDLTAKGTRCALHVLQAVWWPKCRMVMNLVSTDSYCYWYMDLAYLCIS